MISNLIFKKMTMMLEQNFGNHLGFKLLGSDF